MSPPKFAALFSMTAELSDRLQSFGASMMAFAESSVRMQALGQTSRWGEKIGFATPRVSEVTEPAFNNPWSKEQIIGDTSVHLIQLPRPIADHPLQLVQAIGWQGGAAFQSHSSPAQLLSLAGAAGQPITHVGTAALKYAPAISEAMTKLAAITSSVDFDQRPAEHLAAIRTRAPGVSFAEKFSFPNQTDAIDAPISNLLLEHGPLIGSKSKQGVRFAGAGTAWSKTVDDAVPAAIARRWRLFNLHDSLANSSKLGAFGFTVVQLLSSGMDWEGSAPRVSRSLERLKSFQSTLSRIAYSFGHLPLADLWDSIKAVSSGNSGALENGIWAGIEWPSGAAGPRGLKIGGHFLFHSIPPYSLAADSLLNFKVGDPFGKRIKPVPVVSAVDHLVLARAVAAQIAQLDTAPISINYAPVINASGLDEHQLLRLLERHAYELRRIISRQQERRERLAFA